MKKAIEYNIEWAKQQVIPEFIFFGNIIIIKNF